MSQEYTILPSDASQLENSEVKSATHIEISTSHILAFAITVLCTLVNFLTIPTPSTSALATTKPQDFLERPSTYIGLEKIHYDSADEARRQFDNYPFLLTQISEKEPARIWDDDALQRFTKLGTVSPEIRRLTVTSKISSVAQFRAIDYGYEKCSLHIALEGIADADGEVASNTTLDVWVLDATRRLESSLLSWRTRPPRKSFLGSVSLVSDQSVHVGDWTCRWGEFQTFELGCARDADDTDCLLDIWQNPRNNSLGVFLKQWSSLVPVP